MTYMNIILKSTLSIMLIVLSTCVHATSLQTHFLSALIPQVKAALHDIETERQGFKKLWHQSQKQPLSPQQLQSLQHLAGQYHIQHWRADHAQSWEALKRRVDTWPISLILAQAAIESNWGRSRFAQEGNNLFGLHCHTTGCGIVPKHRAPHQHYEVQRFPDQLSCIRTYLHTLNTHPAYQALRHVRATARDNDQPLSSLDLAKNLTQYSERGEQYVIDLTQLIQRHHLQDFDTT